MRICFNISKKAAVLAAFVLYYMVSFSHAQNAVGFPTGTLTIETRSGPVEFKVEIADTETRMAQGLMFRRELKPNHGMVFLYDYEQEITMWMKNTYISLDMVFFSSDWRVTRIVTNTEPLSTDIVSSGQKAQRVLEIAAGQAQAQGIKPGDKATFKR